MFVIVYFIDCEDINCQRSLLMIACALDKIYIGFEIDNNNENVLPLFLFHCQRFVCLQHIGQNHFVQMGVSTNSCFLPTLRKILKILTVTGFSLIRDCLVGDIEKCIKALFYRAKKIYVVIKELYASMIIAPYLTIKQKKPL